jgi:N-acetyl-anhydromuramyl-L-alanine amidase AmpD
LKSPLGFFPGKSVNAVYLGIELIPLLTRQKDGSLFTPHQYESLSAILRGLRDQHNLPFGAGYFSVHLLGHEDINPLARFNSRGGWDPGSLNDDPTFDWSRLSL